MCNVCPLYILIVKLRSMSRSRSGEGQVRVRKVRFGPEQYPIFGFHQSIRVRF